MIVKLLDINKLTEKELVDIVEQYWIQDRSVTEVWINKKCWKFIYNTWTKYIPAWETCSKCGHTSTNGYKKVKAWEGIDEPVYNSDFALTKIVVKK